MASLNRLRVYLGLGFRLRLIFGEIGFDGGLGFRLVSFGVQVVSRVWCWIAASLLTKSKKSVQAGIRVSCPGLGVQSSVRGS